MTWVCAHCTHPNTYWKNSCENCGTPLPGFERPPQPTMHDDKSPCHPDNGGIAGVVTRVRWQRPHDCGCTPGTVCNNSMCPRRFYFS